LTKLPIAKLVCTASKFFKKVKMFLSATLSEKTKIPVTKERKKNWPWKYF